MTSKSNGGAKAAEDLIKISGELIRSMLRRSWWSPHLIEPLILSLNVQPFINAAHWR